MRTGTDYTTLYDEQLAVAFHLTGDQECLNELHRRYMKPLAAKAKQASQTYFSVPTDSFYSEFLTTLWKSADTYDPQRKLKDGETPTFKIFLGLNIRKAIVRVYRQLTHSRTRDGIVLKDEYKAEKYSLDDPLTSSDDSTVIGGLMAKALRDFKNSPGERDMLREHPIVQAIEKKLGLDAVKMVQLKMDGYTHEEIALQCGRDGSKNTLIKWTSRMFEKIQDVAHETQTH